MLFHLWQPPKCCHQLTAFYLSNSSVFLPLQLPVIIVSFTRLATLALLMVSLCFKIALIIHFSSNKSRTHTYTKKIFTAQFPEMLVRQCLAVNWLYWSTLLFLWCISIRWRTDIKTDFLCITWSRTLFKLRNVWELRFDCIRVGVYYVHKSCSLL